MKERLGVLDGLRGIAVLLVLWYHLWEISWLPAPFPWLQFVPETGFIGVTLFFYLSGFVISYPFSRAKLAGQPTPTWGHFASRRLIKILPSYLLSIAIAYTVGYAASQSLGAPAWRDLLAHILFVHTWWYQTAGSINGVLWTLAVEVEFYCIFPIVWWCFSRRPWFTAAVMIAVSLIWRSWAAQCCLNGAFGRLEENLPGFLDIFAFGLLSAWLFARYRESAGASLRPRLAPLVAIGGIAALVALLLNLYGTRAQDQWAAVWMIRNQSLVGAAFATIALPSLLSPGWWKASLANPVLRFLAIISYNLYLYHQLIARELLLHHMPPYSGNQHADAGWPLPYTLVAIAVTVAQAMLVTFLFERPIMRLHLRRVSS